ncbi:MAG: tetratricopeptide repeat protein [Pseudomonadota bacterium]
MAIFFLLATPAVAQTLGPSKPVAAGYDKEKVLAAILFELKSARDLNEAKPTTARLYRLLMLAPDAGAAALMNKGIRAAHNGNFRDALITFNDLVARNPEWPEAWNQRAYLHFRTRNFNAAIVDCEKTLELEPRHLGCLTGLAITHIRITRRYKAGRSVLRRALALHPTAHERKLLDEIPTGY